MDVPSRQRMRQEEEVDLEPGQEELTSIELSGYAAKQMSWASNSQAKLWEMQLLCDITLRASDGERQAHQLVLASGSLMLRAMLTSSMGETRPSGVVDLGDYCVACVDAILAFLYRGTCSVTYGTITQVLAAASYLDIPLLQDLCVNFLEQHLSPSNIFTLWSTAQTFDLECLGDTCDKFIALRIKEIARSQEFATLPVHTLKNLLSLSLACCEEEVFEALLVWAKANPDHRDALPDLLELVRFPLMAAGFVNAIDDPMVVACANWKDLLLEANHFLLGKSLIKGVRTQPRCHQLRCQKLVDGAMHNPHSIVAMQYMRKYSQEPAPTCCSDALVTMGSNGHVRLWHCDNSHSKHAKPSLSLENSWAEVTSTTEAMAHAPAATPNAVAPHACLVLVNSCIFVWASFGGPAKLLCLQPQRARAPRQVQQPLTDMLHLAQRTENPDGFRGATAMCWDMADNNIAIVAFGPVIKVRGLRNLVRTTDLDLTGHHSSVLSMATDGRLLASVSTGQLVLWEKWQLRNASTFKHQPVQVLSLEPDEHDGDGKPLPAEPVVVEFLGPSLLSLATRHSLTIFQINHRSIDHHDVGGPALEQLWCARHGILNHVGSIQSAGGVCTSDARILIHCTTSCGKLMSWEFKRLFFTPVTGERCMPPLVGQLTFSSNIGAIHTSVPMGNPYQQVLEDKLVGVWDIATSMGQVEGSQQHIVANTLAVHTSLPHIVFLGLTNGGICVADTSHCVFS